MQNQGLKKKVSDRQYIAEFDGDDQNESLRLRSTAKTKYPENDDDEAGFINSLKQNKIIVGALVLICIYLLLFTFKGKEKSQKFNKFLPTSLQEKQVKQYTFVKDQQKKVITQQSPDQIEKDSEQQIKFIDSSKLVPQKQQNVDSQTPVALQGKQQTITKEQQEKDSQQQIKVIDSSKLLQKHDNQQKQKQQAEKLKKKQVTQQSAIIEEVDTQDDSQINDKQQLLKEQGVGQINEVENLKTKKLKNRVAKNKENQQLKQLPQQKIKQIQKLKQMGKQKELQNLKKNKQVTTQEIQQVNLQEKKDQEVTAEEQSQSQSNSNAIIDKIKKLFSFGEEDNKEKQASQDLVIKYQLQLQKQEQDVEIADKYLSKQLIEALKQYRYYDIHYFVEDKHTEETFKMIQSAKPRKQEEMNEKRKLLQITHTEEELEQIIDRMMYPQYRPPKMPDWQVYRNKSVEIIDLTYYNYELTINPNRQDYIESEYYRLNKLYNIGKYDKQLPLCVVLAGKNTAGVLDKCYDSIKRQNYTNYRVVHIDDNSNDGTIEKAIDYLQENPFFKDRLTLINQKYQRNALYNRNFGVVEYCQDGDIVVDMDADDWIIGNQVFQLVNTLYQKGNVHKGKREQLWLAYMTNIGYITGCCPFVALVGQIPYQWLQSNRYRYEAHWRTTQLRTYLWKLYKKVNKTDMVDPLILKEGQFFVQAYDTYMNYAMVQMSGPKHLKILDEFNYFYSGSPPRGKHIQTYYCQLNIQTMRGYQQINSLNDQPQRLVEFSPNKTKVVQLQERKVAVKELLQKIRKRILELYERDKKRGKSIQKRKVYRKTFQDKKLGELQYLAVDLKKIQNINKDKNISVYGLQQSIQIASEYDYPNLRKNVDLDRLEKRMRKSIAHQILQFNYKEALELKPQVIKYEKFKSEQEIQNLMGGIIKSKNSKKEESLQLKISMELSTRLAAEPKNKKYQQIEYYYINKKYKIDKIEKEAPICIFSSGFQSFTNNQHKPFFESIQLLNYTNFHVVFVDDYSNDMDAYQIYKYLNDTNSKVKNNIKIIKNLQHLGNLANEHIWIKQFCNPDDIVVIIDSEDKLIGSQVLQVLNSVYLDPQTWFTFSNYLIPLDHGKYNFSNISKLLNNNLRDNNVVSTMGLRSFRKKLIDAVPLEHLIEYSYKNETGRAYPQYYNGQQFLTASLIQISGLERTKFLSDFFYVNGAKIKKNCPLLIEPIEQIKFGLKYPALKLQSQDDQPKLNEEKKNIPQKSLLDIKIRTDQLKKCEQAEKKAEQQAKKLLNK